ncbi:MAG: hypothetical protein ACI8V5_003715 [Limisphaerales bacterium]|jgi:hypothetical protein
MNLIDSHLISIDAKIVILKFGQAQVTENDLGKLLVHGGAASDRNAARVWINHIAPLTNLRTWRDSQGN